jgi:hypothetical protein
LYRLTAFYSVMQSDAEAQADEGELPSWADLWASVLTSNNHMVCAGIRDKRLSMRTMAQVACCVAALSLGCKARSETPPAPAATGVAGSTPSATAAASPGSMPAATSAAPPSTPTRALPSDGVPVSLRLGGKDVSLKLPETFERIRGRSSFDAKGNLERNPSDPTFEAGAFDEGFSPLEGIKTVERTLTVMLDSTADSLPKTLADAEREEVERWGEKPCVVLRKEAAGVGRDFLVIVRTSRRVTITMYRPSISPAGRLLRCTGEAVSMIDANQAWLKDERLVAREAGWMEVACTSLAR